MALPAAIAAAAPYAKYALPFLPNIVQSIFGSGGSNRTPYEMEMENKLRSIINKGGLGLDEEQLTSRYQQMIKELQPMFRAQKEAYDVDAAGRGIYKSGVALEKGKELGQKQTVQMATLLQNLIQWNEEQKMNSLMKALGMGTGMAQYGGELSRLGKAQNQGAFQGMWGQLMNLLVEKDFFDFDKPLNIMKEETLTLPQNLA